MTHLSRQLGLFSATALVISNMVGTGIFATTGFLAGDLGAPKWVMLVWLAGGIFAFCGAITYAELGINFPKSGGEYLYLTEAYGSAWGFISGWTSFFAGFSAPVAAAALAFSEYTAAIFPSIKAGGEWQFGSGEFTIRVGVVQCMAAGLIALCTALNCFGIRRVARIQNLLTVTKLAVLATFILLAVFAGNGSLDHFSQTTERTSSYSLPVQLMISLLWVMVSYSGWNAAAYVAEELREPHKTLPLALAAGTAIVTILYLALNAIFIYSTPLGAMKGEVSVGSISAENLFGQRAGNIFAALMAIAIVSTVNAMVMIGPRVYYAMARDREFFPSAAKLHPRWQTPTSAIICQGICAMAMAFTSLPQLVLYIGFSLTVFSSLAVASIFLFRQRPDWQKLNALNFAYPLIPATYLITGVAMVIYGLIWQPAASIASLLTIAAGLISHFYFAGSVRDWTENKETGD